MFMLTCDGNLDGSTSPVLCAFKHSMSSFSNVDFISLASSPSHTYKKYIYKVYWYIAKIFTLKNRKRKKEMLWIIYSKRIKILFLDHFLYLLSDITKEI